MAVPNYLKILNFLIPASLRSCPIIPVCLGLGDFLGCGLAVLRLRQSPIWCHILARDENLASLPSSTAALFSLALADADLELGPFSAVIPAVCPNVTTTLSGRGSHKCVWWSEAMRSFFSPGCSVPSVPTLLSVHTPFPLGFHLTRKSSHFIRQNATSTWSRTS